MLLFLLLKTNLEIEKKCIGRPIPEKKIEKNKSVFFFFFFVSSKSKNRFVLFANVLGRVCFKLGEVHHRFCVPSNSMYN